MALSGRSWVGSGNKNENFNVIDQILIIWAHCCKDCGLASWTGCCRGCGLVSWASNVGQRSIVTCGPALVSLYIERNIQLDKYTTWQSQWSFSLSPHLSFLPFINLNFSLFRSLTLGERGQQKGKHSLYDTSSGRLWCGWLLGVVDTQSQLFLLPTFWSKVWKLGQKHQPHFGNCYSLLIQILDFNKFFRWFVHTITFRKHWARMPLWDSPKFSYWQIQFQFLWGLWWSVHCLRSVSFQSLSFWPFAVLPGRFTV